MPSVDEIKSQLASTLPTHLQDEVGLLVDKATQLDNGKMTAEQLLNLLVADERVAHLLAEIAQPDHRDNINASQSQGFIANPTGPINQVIVNGNIDAGALVQLLRSAGASPADTPTTQQDPTITLYRQQFADALRRLTPAKYDFPLTFAIIPPIGAPEAADTGIAIDQLLKRAQIARLLLVRGSAGAGKSTVMRRVADQLTQSDQTGVVPIFFQLRELGKDIGERLGLAVKDDAEPEQYIEPLLTASIVPLGLDDLKRLGERASSIEGGLILVIADGLNEIYGEEVASSILKRLTTYVTMRGLKVCVLVTDRVTPRDAVTKQWQLVRLERLTPEVVHTQFDDKGSDVIYNQLHETDLTLLQTPYFLEYALDHNATRLSSPTEALASFFEHLGQSEDALDRLAQAAFTVYADHHSYKFDAAHFAEVVGQETFQVLTDDGVVVIIPADADAQRDDQHRGDQAQFDHQLKHDYLAARYLSQHQDEWNPPALDALSFESNSFDALSMTFELLPDEEQADKFIERLHNWNWAAAFVCIAKAMRVGSGRHSQEMHMAVLALVAEKLFDPVQQTRERASGVLALFPPDQAAPYQQMRGLKDLCAMVQQQVLAEGQYKDREPWFTKWRDLFVRFSDQPFSEQDLKKIVDTRAVIGWTAANVFKRAKLSELDVRQLRAYYDACYACDANDWLAGTMRWRVAHALGATDTQPVVELLFAVLNQDNYTWARIGATRSLVELAALTADDGLRRMVLDSLMENIKAADTSTLDAKTLREIGQSAFYCNAHGDWEQAATPLIALMRDMQQSAPEQEWWSTLLVQFKAFCQEQAAAIGGAPGQSRTM
jgi:hypothetical protein